MKLTEKFTDVKEQQRLDRNDYNSKLAQFKVDVSTMVFEPPTHKFLKEKVFPGWSGVVSTGA